MSQLRLFKKWELLIDAAVRNEVLELKIRLQAVQGNKMAQWIVDQIVRKQKLTQDLLADLGVDWEPEAAVQLLPVMRLRGEIKSSGRERARKAWITRRANLAKKRKKK